jgi:quinol-cytochrome oxidoreductase complex cytochrome b subunit
MAENTNKKQIVFYPNFLFREAVAALIMVIVVVAMALLMPMKVGDPADPSDSSFKPRPEWYFMAPFYLLKIFPSSLEVIPTVIGPILTFVFLLILPFVDKNPEMHPKKRKLAMSLMGGGVLLTILFTVLGILA